MSEKEYTMKDVYAKFAKAWEYAGDRPMKQPPFTEYGELLAKTTILVDVCKATMDQRDELLEALELAATYLWGPNKLSFRKRDDDYERIKAAIAKSSAPMELDHDLETLHDARLNDE